MIRGILVAVALATAAGAATLDVRQPPFSAAGDGTADDTRAIQSALNRAGAEGGGIVLLPAGRYLVKTHLTVPAGTTLQGVARAPREYDPRSPGSLLLAVEGAGNPAGTPFLTLAGANSAIEGISVFYPNQIVAETPVAYPWTVRGGPGHNVAIINVLLVNPYQAVDLATSGTSRHYIRGLYGQPLFKGLWVDRCYDIGRVHDVHFWPFWSLDDKIIRFQVRNATAFIFQRTDWEVVENVFCWGYHVGMEFSASKDGSMNGQLSDIGLDAVDIGVDVRESQGQGIAFSNLSIANDNRGTEHIAILGRPGPRGAHLFIRGGAFWGYWNRIARWENSGVLSLSMSRLTPFNSPSAMVELLAGQAMLHDNSIDLYPGLKVKPAPGVAVSIGAGVQGALVHDNQLNGHRVDNQAGARAVVSNNLP